MNFSIQMNLLVVCTWLAASASQATAQTNDTKLYVHYMPWFETPETLGGDNWGFHWELENRDPNIILPNGQREIASHFYPLIGPYSSRDPIIIEYHLLLMKIAGADGILIDWYGVEGINGDIDNLLVNSNSIVSRTPEFGMDFAVVLEDRFAQSVADVSTNVAYLRDNYFDLPNYIRTGPQDQPLLLNFGPITIENPNDWTTILANAGEDVAFLPLAYQSDDAGANSDGEFNWIFEDESLDNHLSVQQFFLESHSPSLDMVGAVAYPGFVDFYEEGGTDVVIGFEIPHDGGNTLQQTLLLADQFSDNIDFVQVATWNDFNEGTIIEPTLEFGFQYLTQLQDFTGTPWGEDELKLVLDLYRARREFTDANSQQILDQASAELSHFNFGLAQQLISSVNDGVKRTILFDFGSDDSFRGISVPVPDLLGDQWLSVWSGTFYANVVDSIGVVSDIDFGFSAAMGTDFFNGPAGTVQDPSQSVYDALALGNLGVDEAVYDYYVSSQFQIQDLDIDQRYRLTFFGSHKFNNDDITRYSIFSDGSYANEVASVDLQVGTGNDHNQSEVAILDGLQPSSDGVLYVGFAGANGGNGYLNAMKLEILDPRVVGDVNGDGFVNLLDVAPFVEILTSGGFSSNADINQDGFVNLLDVSPFVLLLSGS